MKAIQKTSPIRLFCICALMFSLLFTGTMPVQAAELTNEYDFSSVDAIDLYDTYKKLVSADGTPYVETGKHHLIDTSRPKPLDYYRYGSFLRNSDEKQRYAVFNLDYTGAATSSVPQNVLTIYADPEVDFFVTDVNNVSLADSSGYYDSQKVVHYRKSVDNGHSLYYIQLKPVATGTSTTMIEFETTSTTTQPHYSFWFGHPLMKTSTASCGLFNMSVKAPSRASANVSVASPYSIPSSAWVTKVTLSKYSTAGAANVDSGNMYLILPGKTSAEVKRGFISDTTTVYECTVNLTSGSRARGTFQFYLGNMSWDYYAPSGSTYLYTGNMTMEYVYSFGY